MKRLSSVLAAIALAALTLQADTKKLTEEQRLRFMYACVQLFCFYEDLFLQRSHGLLPKEYFNAWCKALEDDLRDPGFVSYWRQERLTYVSEFRRYIDDTIKKYENEGLISTDRQFLVAG